MEAEGGAINLHRLFLGGECLGPQHLIGGRVLAATPDNYSNSGQKLFRDRVEALDLCGDFSNCGQKNRRMLEGESTTSADWFSGGSESLSAALFGGERVLAATHE